MLLLSIHNKITIGLYARAFVLVITQPSADGSARPLQVVDEYGNTPLELIALQTYHMCQLHPASAFQSARLPWVLHLADKTRGN